MKKIYSLFSVAMVIGSISGTAQNVLLNMDFNNASYPNIVDLANDPSLLGAANDTNWYVWDGDGLTDGSPQGTRPGGWWLTYAFADADVFQSNGVDSNVVLTSNSWFDAPAQANNYFISPSVMLGAHDTLFWRSAPFQTPRYLDGYKVLLSTTSNSDGAFTNVLFTAAEMTGSAPNGAADSANFSAHSFGPSGAFVHGLDGNYVEQSRPTATYTGTLRPFRVPLDSAGFANQKVFIAFLHDSFDDNLLSIDDIMIRGTLPSVGIDENDNSIGLNLYPNPASDFVQAQYSLAASTNVTISVYDVTGKLVNTISKGNEPSGRHFASINTSLLAKGFYTIAVQTATGLSTAKLIVK